MSKSVAPLGRASLAGLAASGATIPGYDLDAVGIGVVHIGLGAFHRAHQAAFFDDALARFPGFGVCATSLNSPQAMRDIAAQDGLFTVTTCADVRRTRVIGAIREAVAPSGQAFIERVSAPATRLVTLTVTEKGYCRAPSGEIDFANPDVQHDMREREAPRTMPGLLLRALKARMQSKAGPIAVLSCDNLSSNGTALQRVMASLIEACDKDLGAWVEDTVLFPDTMVDSITPATDEALHVHLRAAFGIRDACAVQREPFTQWVVGQELEEVAPELAECGVIFARDVGAHERAKLRLLNGPHSTLAYLGLLAGKNTVSEAMGDAALAGFVRAMMDREIAPGLGSGGPNVASYSDDVLSRFRNAGIMHRLSQIAMDGSQKLPVRIVQTITENIVAGRSVERLTFVLGAWFRFIAREAAAARTLMDPLSGPLLDAGRVATGRGEVDLPRFLDTSGIAPDTLRNNGAFLAALSTGYVTAQRLEREGSDVLQPWGEEEKRKE